MTTQTTYTEKESCAYGLSGYYYTKSMFLNGEVEVTNKYLLFAGDHYYPSGGMCDFVGIFDSIESARTQLSHNCDWYQIVDVETLKVIESY